jgi:hypothetical protein
MSLQDALREHVAAAFSGIWVQSHEHDDALADIGQLCRSEGWRLAVWDLEQGLRLSGAPAETQPAGNDPLAALRSAKTMGADDGAAILVLVNFHRFLHSAEIVQALATLLAGGKRTRTCVLILAPLVQLPTELEKLFVILEHALPDRQQLREIAEGVATADGELPSGEELRPLLDAAAGLTRVEAENAFSLSLVRHGRLQADTLWELKCQTLKQSGLVQLYRGNERFEQLGGLDSLKTFCARALSRTALVDCPARPRGVLLLSPPGCGKSAFAKALGNETGRPTLVLDVGSLLGSLVGQSEANTRRALALIDAMAPAIVFLDEVEKAFSGVGASGQTDSGVAARLFGSFLSWLNDHESDVFVVATSNDIGKLPPEFSRAERFDGVFFVDLPDSEQRLLIWKLYLDQYRLELNQELPADEGWSGAEIKSCCRLAALLDVPLVAAAQNIVPVSRTSAESVDQLRRWATGRCLSADRPGVYTARDTSAKERRRVHRSGTNPSHN